MPLGAARLSLLAYQATVAASGRIAKTFITVKNPEISTAQNKFGGTSALFQGTHSSSGTSDSVRTQGHNDFIFTGDLTWECWVYFVDNGTNDSMTIMSNRGTFNSTNLYFTGRHSDQKWQWGNSTMGANITTQTWNYNTWYHIALVRSGSGSNNFAFYVNGTALQTDTDTNTIGSSGSSDYIALGSIYNASTPSFGLNGYIDEVRISTTARYTSSFTPSGAAFQNDSDTVLLMHMNGANGSTTFTDDTVTPVRPAVTLTGQDDQVITTHEQSKFGALSVEMSSGGADWILVDHTAQDIDYGDDFTYEFWFRTSSLPSLFYMFATGSTRGDYIALYNKSGTWTLAAPVSNGSTVYTQIRNIGSTPATNTWHHIALVKDGSNLNMFFNGTLLTVNNGSAGTMSSTYGWDGVNRIGAWATNTSYGFSGHLDEVRFSKSVRYTSSFTPATTAFANDNDTLLLVHFDEPTGSQTFTDDNTSIRVAQEISMPYGGGSQAKLSTTQSQFGGSSAYFDGNNDVIGIGDSSDSNFVLLPKTGVFTWEMWARAQDTTFQQISTVYGAYGDANPAGRTWIGIDGSNKWTFSGNGGPTIASSTNANNTTWTHLAVVRNSSNQFNFFVNGQSQGTSTNSYTIASGYVSIGANANSYGLEYEGYVDEFRISNTARYTGNFTPSITPFVNDTDTLVLLHMDGLNNARQTSDDNR